MQARHRDAVAASTRSTGPARVDLVDACTSSDVAPIAGTRALEVVQYEKIGLLTMSRFRWSVPLNTRPTFRRYTRDSSGGCGGVAITMLLVRLGEGSARRNIA